MNSYEENEMRKVGAKVQSCANFAQKGIRALEKHF
jgi:hypothetical protein